MQPTARQFVLAAPATRCVVVHYHIFKNAGSTIEGILNREFGSQYATVHGPAANSTLDADDLHAFLYSRPEIEAISSHHLRYPKPAIRHTVIFDWCFFRDPLDRLYSLYTYFRQMSSTDSLAVQARRQSAGAFLEDLLRTAPHQVSNVQVNLLANGGAFTRPANEADLDRATAVIKEMSIPGLIDMFDESLVAAEYFLKPAFPELQLHYVKRNVSRRTQWRSVERSTALATEFGPELYRKLTRTNQLDIELCRRAKVELTRRLGLVPDLPARLTEFRSRCAGHDTERIAVAG